jgi:hypothetical protein
MLRLLSVWLALGLGLSGVYPASAARHRRARPAPTRGALGRHISVNGVPLSSATLQALEGRYGGHIPNGRYWYDKLSGAWGRQGGLTLGFTLAGLDLGGPLRANASGGSSQIFVNGRRLPRPEVAALEQLLQTRVAPGRYWLNAAGYAGYEGGPPLANLFQLAQQLWRVPGTGGVGENYGGGAYAYRNSNTGIGIISDGEGGMAITR